MKTRVIRRDGYENGAALAQAWQEDGLIPMPHGEVFEFYRLVDKEAVARLGDEEGMQGPELNLLEPFVKHARLMGREQDVARIREWTEPRLLDAVGEIHRERLAEPFDPHRFPEMQGLAQYQDREAKGIADVFGTGYRRILLYQDQYRRLVYLSVSGEAEPAPAAAGNCTSVIFKDSPVGPSGCCANTSPTRAWRRCAASCATTRRRRRCASISTRCRRTIRWRRCTASSWCHASGSITSGLRGRDPNTPCTFEPTPHRFSFG